MVRVIATLMLILATPLVSGDYPKLTVEEDALISEAKASRSFDKYEAWINACMYTKYTCGFLAVPKVKYETMRGGLLGYYDGGDTVYINRKARGWSRKEVLMHEMVHYIQVQVGDFIVPGPAEQICRAEEEAFTTVDQWLRDNNKDRMVVGPDWWRPYTHCWKYYDPEWGTYEEWEQQIWELRP